MNRLYRAPLQNLGVLVFALAGCSSQGPVSRDGRAADARASDLVADRARIEAGDRDGPGDGTRTETGSVLPPDASVDECDSTPECVAIWGKRATDCVNSQSEQSYCQCGGVRCSQLGSDAGTPDQWSVPPDKGPLPTDKGSVGPTGFYFEVESIAPVSPWVKETKDPGYSGAAYFRWPDLATNANGITSSTNAALVYSFTVKTSGIYLFEVRGRRDHEGWCLNAPDDACNDVWARIDSGTWTKKMVKGTWGTWLWDGKWEPGASVVTTEVSLTAGNHSYSLSGRSNGVKIDAVRIYLKGTAPPQP